MILVLDTDALWHRPLLDALGDAQVRGLTPLIVEAVLPAVAFAERVRQVESHGRDRMELRDALADSGIRIEPFGAAEGERIPARLPLATWKAHARDFLIAVHVHGARIGVSSDRGPAWAGRPVRTPAEATAAVRALLAANT